MGAARKKETREIHVNLREARIRAEVRDEADPALHARIICTMEDVADLINGSDSPLGDAYEPLDIAEGVRALIDLTNAADEAAEKKLEETKAEHAKAYDALQLQCDALRDERDRAKEEAVRVVKSIDPREQDRIRDQAHTLEVLAQAIVGVRDSLRVIDESDTALLLARSILGIEVPPAAPTRRRRTAKVKP